MRGYGIAITSFYKGVDAMFVEMKNIRKSFGSNAVLKDVSFTLKGGEICALLGENGAGKSTLMNILGGVHQMDSGSISLDGKQVKFATLHNHRRLELPLSIKS